MNQRITFESLIKINVHYSF